MPGPNALPGFESSGNEYPNVQHVNRTWAGDDHPKLASITVWDEGYNQHKITVNILDQVKTVTVEGETKVPYHIHIELINKLNAELTKLTDQNARAVP